MSYNKFNDDEVTKWIAIVVVAAVIVFLIVTFAPAEDVIKGEKINFWTQMTERNGASFTIDSATYEVIGTDSGVWASVTDATVDGGIVSGYVDTTFATFTVGNRGYVKFFYYILPKQVMIYKMPIKIFE